MRIGQRPAIELAVGGEGQRVEHDEGRGHHVVGQTRGEILAQGASIDLGNQRDVGDELLILRIVVACTRDDHRFTHRRMAGDLRLDLAEFDTEAANLDLMVIAPKKFEAAVRPIASKVTRAIETGAGNERIVEETLGGELGPVQIATRHTRATDVKLAYRTNRRQLTLRIEQIDRQIRNTHPDRAVAVRTVLASQRPVGHVYGRLGDAVHVDQSRLLVRMSRVPGFERRRIQRLAAEDHVAQRSGGVVCFLRLNEGAKGAGRLIENGDALLLKQAKEIGCEASHMLRHDHQLSAIAQRAPQLPNREIEGERVEQAPDIALIEAEPVLSCVEQAHDLGVLYHHALGLAGGAGGVDHVGEVTRGDNRLRIVLRECVTELRVGIEHGEHAGFSQRFAACGVGEQQPWCGVGEDVVQTLARVGWIERHVSTPGLEDGE
ncbi:hypothetical protein BGLT_02658 [Caballeronia glathei]|nr:hypothetical protein BGLT_02658 [Caballeronia glathei]